MIANTLHGEIHTMAVMTMSISGHVKGYPAIISYLVRRSQGGRPLKYSNKTKILPHKVLRV